MSAYDENPFHDASLHDRVPLTGPPPAWLSDDVKTPSMSQPKPSGVEGQTQNETDP